MPLYGGIDLHANNSVIVLLNEQDQVIYQQRLANHLPTILEQLAPYQADITGVVVESTSNWYWLVDGLMEAGYRVHLANPLAMQQYSGLKYTNDHADARGPCCRGGVWRILVLVSTRSFGEEGGDGTLWHVYFLARPPRSSPTVRPICGQRSPGLRSMPTHVV